MHTMRMSYRLCMSGSLLEKQDRGELSRSDRHIGPLVVTVTRIIFFLVYSVARRSI